jgi:hypothetical protein
MRGRRGEKWSIADIMRYGMCTCKVGERLGNEQWREHFMMTGMLMNKEVDRPGFDGSITFMSTLRRERDMSKQVC